MPEFDLIKKDLQNQSIVLPIKVTLDGNRNHEEGVCYQPYATGVDKGVTTTFLRCCSDLR